MTLIVFDLAPGRRWDREKPLRVLVLSDPGTSNEVFIFRAGGTGSAWKRWANRPFGAQSKSIFPLSTMVCCLECLLSRSNLFRSGSTSYRVMWRPQCRPHLKGC